jgi:uncharacterized membrane protein YdbT with pleckstrin-like domain
MGYVDTNLIQGERVIYRAPLHWRVMLLPLLLAAALLFVAVLAVRQVLVAGTGDNTLPWLIAALILFVFAAIPIAKAGVARRTSEFAVTNKRVILKTGLIHNKTAEMFLAKVESVGVDQTILGRIFGYGSIELRGTGGSLEPFENISRPLEFRRQIQEQIGKSLEERTQP